MQVYIAAHCKQGLELTAAHLGRHSLEDAKGLLLDLASLHWRIIVESVRDRCVGALLKWQVERDLLAEVLQKLQHSRNQVEQGS